VDLLNAQGFAGKYTFAYAPVNFVSGICLGRAVVCLTTCQVAEQLMVVMHDFQGISASWNEPIQGTEALIERYRNSPVMHAIVPDMFKPAFFSGCERVPFPAPTKAIKAPRMRKPVSDPKNPNCVSD
jgi:hypothetical protein